MQRIVAAALLVSLAGASGAVKATDVSVALYQGDRIAVVTMTFDDTKPSQLERVVPLFNEFGYKCTFYVNSSRIGPNKQTSWEQWRAVAEAGFEVGNHTKGHWLKANDPDNSWCRDQILGGYKEIEDHIGIPPHTFAFPGGSVSERTLKVFRESAHIDYRHRNHKKKGDRLWVGEQQQTVEAGPGFVDRVMAHEETWNKSKLSWMITVMHDVTDEKERAIRAMLEYIKKHDDKVWCTTYSTATRYEREREESRLTVTESGDRYVAFSVTNSLDQAVFNVPLTVRIDTSHAPETASAILAGTELPTQVRGQRILVDVVPGREQVRVTWQ